MRIAAQPIQIGSKTLKNRITFAPTVKFDWSDGSGLSTDRFTRHYEERAAGGAGLIVVEATCVDPEGRLSPDQLGLWNDEQVAGHRDIVEACRPYNTVMLVQIHHAGYQTHEDCGPVKGPSAVDWKGHQSIAMTVEEIHQVRDQFIAAARRAQQAGYDGIQLHACHSYLLNQFVSPRVNIRTDAYGGNTENRTRLACEIIRGIREACGSDFLISARTTGAEPTVEEAFAIADAYVAAGLDYVQVSGGIGPQRVVVPEDFGFGWITYVGTQMYRHMAGRVPVSIVYGILKPEQAHALLQAALADTLDSARALLSDPDWTHAVLEGTPYVACHDCKQCQWFPKGHKRCPALRDRKKLERVSVDYEE